jgi:7-keto-8-aminopelargonate synthetase-like enzyme
VRTEVNHTLDLTATTNQRSVTPDVEVPLWAKSLSVYVGAAGGWGTGTPAVVSLERRGRGVSSYAAFSPAATATGTGGATAVTDDLNVARASQVRARTSTAGVTGSVDTDAAVTFVFSDEEVN